MADDDLLDASGIYDADFGKETGLELDASSIYSPDWRPPPQPETPERGDFMSGVYSGANSFMGLMNYAKAAVGALSDNEDWIREGIKTAEQYEAKAAEYGQGRVTDWDSVVDAGSMVDYFQFGLGTLAPYAAESVVTGAIGAAAGSAAAPGAGTVTGVVGGMVAKQAAKDLIKQYAKKELKGMSKEAIERKVKKNFKEYAAGTILPENRQLVESAIKRTAMKMGATMGSMAGTYPIGLGDVASNIIGEDKQLTAGEAGVAAGLAIPYAALDVLPEFVGISRLLNPAGGNIFQRTATGFLSQAPIEAATEVAQEEINIRTRAAYDPEFDPYGVEAWKQRRESAILGAAGGGVFGAATGLMPGGDAEMQGLELDIKSNIEQAPKSDFKSVDGYNQAIIDGIFGGTTELSDHAAGRGPTTTRGREVVKPFINQMDIDATPEIGSRAERRAPTPADMPQPPGQQIDTLFAQALSAGMRNSTEVNQFIIDQMYPQGRPLVDHGAEQRPTPEMQRQADIDRLSAAAVIPPTPDMMAEGLGMFPVEPRAGTELPAVNPNDYNRATLEASIRDVQTQQAEAEKGGAKSVLFDLAAGGGIDWDMALAEGLDPADMKAANRKGMPFGMPLFRRGSGNGFDWAAERWSQAGVPGFRFGDTYEETVGGANDALDIVTDMIQGKRDPMFMPGDEYAEMDRQNEVARLENLSRTLENMLDEVSDYEVILQTQGQAAADRFFYHSRMMDVYAEEISAGLWQPGDPVTVNTEFDAAGERLSYLLDKAYEVDPEAAIAEFERLVDATDAEIAAAMYQIIGRSEDAETRAEAEREIERAEAEPEPTAEQRGEEPGVSGAVPAEEAGEREPAETRVTPEEKAVLVDRRKKAKKRIKQFERRGGEERRKAWAQRKDIEAMTEREREAAIEELRRQILTDPMTGLGSREAWEQVEKKEYIAAIDADSLKYVNDKLGNKAGDQLLQKIGAALKAEFGQDAYHVSGDEFWVHSDDAAGLVGQLDKVQERLQTETVTGPGGSMTGLGFSWGIDTTEADADREMKRDKEVRTASGKRVERGERPAGVVLAGEAEPAITTEQLDAAAAEAEKSPSQAKIDADNYKKGKIFSLNGTRNRVETEKGERRRPEYRPLAHHYGHILGTKSSDGDPLDAFYLDDAGDLTRPVFVIDQVDPNRLFAFDEPKIIFGAKTESTARAAYLSNYEDNWQGLGGITEFTWDEFKEWLKGDTTKRITERNEVEPPPALELETQTETELEQLEAEQTAAEAEAAVPAPEAFTLEGAITPAEESAAQEDLFAAPALEPKPGFMIVNNTGKEISLIRPYIDEFAKTGVINDDISDLFSLTKIIVDGQERIIVDFVSDTITPPAEPEPTPYAEFEGRDITWEQETEDGWVTVTVDSAEVLRDYDSRINALEQLVKDCG